MLQNEIFKIYGKNYTEMTKAILRQSCLSQQIPSGVRIGIKPNLVSPTPAEYGATTHPEVVAGIIEYLQEEGYDDIIMLESSWIGDKTSDAYEYCGYRQLTERYGVPFYDMQKDSSSSVESEGMSLKICDKVASLGFMINVPVMKGHGQTKITCALKNMKGLIPNSEKRHFHTMGLHEPIARLSTVIHQDFIVVDHICGDLELEDGGNPIERNCIMTALDPVLVDSYVCHLLGYGVEEVPYVKMAEALGSGSTDLSRARISVFCEERGEYKLTDQFCALDPDALDERRVVSERLLDISYAIEDADSCSACYASLVPAILRLKEEGLYENFIKCLEGKIAIGQGFCGKKGKIGVGNCCRLFNNYVPGCPPEEETVYNFLKETMKKC